MSNLKKKDMVYDKESYPYELYIVEEINSDQMSLRHLVSSTLIQTSDFDRYIEWSNLDA